MSAPVSAGGVGSTPGSGAGSGIPDEPIGRVLGTEDATPLQWHVALREGDYLQLDDVVTTRRAVPGVGEVLVAGVAVRMGRSAVDRLDALESVWVDTDALSD